MESFCKVFLILQFPSIWYALVLKYIILSKFIIKAEVCYLLKCYILAGVNDLMLYLIRLSPLLYLYYIFLLQLQEDHEAPANPKTDSLQMFFSGSRNSRLNFSLNQGLWWVLSLSKITFKTSTNLLSSAPSEKS